MALSKKWKIIWGIVAAFVAGVILLFCLLGVLVKNMRQVSEEIYGGPLPANVGNIIGVDMKPSKIAVVMDKDTQLVFVLIETPQENDGTRPFSEPDVQASLSKLDKSAKEIQNALQGVGKGEPGSFELGQQKVHTISYHDEKGMNSLAGVLNLKDAQLVFIATGATAPEPEAVAHFLGQMPALAPATTEAK